MQWVTLGRLGAPYGVRGWSHVESFTDPPQRLLEYPQWMLRLASGERISRHMEQGRPHGGHLVVKLKEVPGRDAAAALAGAAIEVQRDWLPPPAPREYYRADLEGYAVRNLEGATLGTVSHFVDAPAGAVLVARDSAGREHWILAQPRHLRRVDTAARVVEVDWPVDQD
ncbi:MAG: 16S rRNA processing protein RimM [Proteobacteria bacterium]|nr:16S rRNA processing protein RimM [Pseudomonadota bacterium]